jgi:hypothetical protein
MIGWTILLFLGTRATLLPLNLFLILDNLGGTELIWNIIIAILVTNAGLFFAVIVIGLFAEYPIAIIFKWAFTTLVFGFFSAGPMLKMAFKRRNELDSQSDIGSFK